MRARFRLYDIMHPMHLNTWNLAWPCTKSTEHACRVYKTILPVIKNQIEQEFSIKKPQSFSWAQLISRTSTDVTGRREPCPGKKTTISRPASCYYSTVTRVNAVLSGSTQDQRMRGWRDSHPTFNLLNGSCSKRSPGCVEKICKFLFKALCCATWRLEQNHIFIASHLQILSPAVCSSQHGLFWEGIMKIIALYNVTTVFTAL